MPTASRVIDLHPAEWKREKTQPSVRTRGDDSAEAEDYATAAAILWINGDF